jgi:hypothetical protein
LLTPQDWPHEPLLEALARLAEISERGAGMRVPRAVLFLFSRTISGGNAFGLDGLHARGELGRMRLTEIARGKRAAARRRAAANLGLGHRCAPHVLVNEFCSA